MMRKIPKIESIAAIAYKKLYITMNEVFAKTANMAVPL